MSEQQPKREPEPEPTPPPREPLRLEPAEVDWVSKNKHPGDTERR